MSTGPYAEAYDSYRRAGWNGVIPLPPRKKKHPPSGYTGENGAWPSYADCMTWAEGPEGNGNIAIRLPHDVIGIDIDAYDGKPGAHTIADAEARWGPLPATWTSGSRDDGVSRIRFYRAPEGLAWPGEVGPATEIIQHKHRYAVVSPSIHPDTGSTYRWTTPEGVTSTAVPDVDQLPHLPAPWVEGLTGGHTAAEQTPRNDLTTSQVQQWLINRPRALEAPCLRMNAALTGARLSLAAGASAHDTTITAVMRTVRLADEGHGGVLAALTDLHKAFVAEATRPGRPGHTRTSTEAAYEWRRALDGAVGKVSATPSGIDACDCGGRLTDAIVAAAGPPLPSVPPTAGSTALNPQPDPTQAQPDPAQPDAAPASQPGPHDEFIEDQIRTEALKLRIKEEARRRVRREQAGTQTPPSLTPLTAFLAVPDQPQTYRIEGLWPIGGRVMLAAQFKSGKTTFVGNLLRSLADGTPFLDRFLTHTPDGQIALLDDELDENMLRRWLRNQTIRSTDRISVLSLRGRLSTFDILDPDVRTEWATKLRDAGVKTAVIDCLAPLLDALGLSEDKEAGRFLVALDELAGEAGIEELLLVHHMGHTGERARGASRLRDWPDVEWRIVREKEDAGEDNPAARRYFSAYGRDVDVSEQGLDYFPETRRLALVGGSRATAGLDEAAAAVLDYVAVNPGASKNQIELFSGAPQKQARAAVAALVVDGQLVAKPLGRGFAYTLAEPSNNAPPVTSTEGSAGFGTSISPDEDDTTSGPATFGNTRAEQEPQVSEGVRQGSATFGNGGAEEFGNRGLFQSRPRDLPNLSARAPGGADTPTEPSTLIIEDGRLIDTSTGEDLGPAPAPDPQPAPPVREPFDPNSGERLAPAWQAGIQQLGDHKWHDWTTIVQTMVDASDIQPKTASNLLHNGVKSGTLKRRGNHKNGTRQIMLPENRSST